MERDYLNSDIIQFKYNSFLSSLLLYFFAFPVGFVKIQL